MLTVAVLFLPHPIPLIPARSLNELRVLLLEANRHSPGPERDLSREVHKAEWRIKEQKLKDDIRGLREKLTGLVCEGRVEKRNARVGLRLPYYQVTESSNLLRPP